ncbi:SMP-30/gluconolactonase/LRE family protein [Planosporangium thailandense]|uniref:SMP-30/gluconolactonase/LRE family protein n=1 Tax=Planosporangium thailandense TaxID=765197 RepID=A0ABX0Y3I5_9ACTN|nr:SMP-30/gluconolactonase/LRE family protein [Planosporangium thailandense]
MTAEPVDAPACALGESPRWAHGAWWWVDAEAGVLWTADAALTAGGATAVALLRTGGRLSLVHPAADGPVVVASGNDLLLVDASGAAAPRVWSRLDLPAGWVLNDGVADPDGRLWIGAVHPDRLPGSGRLYVVEPDGTARVAAEGFALSNGMAWRSSTVLVHADSLDRCLWRHEVDAGGATVIRSHRTVTFPAEPPGDPDAGPRGLPDGVALDRDGGLWVALYGSGQAWRLVEGRVDTVIEVPTPRVTSVALGGADGRDVLITSAQEGMDEAALAADPLAGRLFRARVAVPAGPVPAARPGH